MKPLTIILNMSTPAVSNFLHYYRQKYSQLTQKQKLEVRLKLPVFIEKETGILVSFFSSENSDVVFSFKSDKDYSKFLIKWSS